MGKLEWCGYPTVGEISLICLAASIEYRHVTDRQTDRLTAGQTDVRQSHYNWVTGIRLREFRRHAGL